VDGSVDARSAAITGDAKISTAQARFGGASLEFDGANDYLMFDPAVLQLGTGDFTVETWFRLAAASSNYRNILATSGPSGVAPTIRFGDSGFGSRLQFAIDAGSFASIYSSQHTQSTLAGSWHHVAFTRSNGVVRAFLDGQLLTVRNNNYSGPSVTSWTDTTSISGITQLVISAGGTNSWQGHLDELRVTAGTARYISNFTPPSDAFPPVSGPQALVGHTPGDLATVVNPQGHITRFDSYDVAGRVRQVTDPRGVVTTTSYTPRGRASSVSVVAPGAAARDTTYTYDGVGQVTAVTLPDGTTLTYGYDAAHRLTSVKDARGNSVTYTLDASGNRIGEDVSDPGNVLRRSIARSFDALNRTQQVTGATE